MASPMGGIPSFSGSSSAISGAKLGTLSSSFSSGDFAVGSGAKTGSSNIITYIIIGVLGLLALKIYKI